MARLDDVYKGSLSLLTDLYQLTMAQGFWKLGRTEDQAVYHLFFRQPPFGGGYAIAAGLSHAVDLLEMFRFDASDIDYLGSLLGNDGEPLFAAGFLAYLRELELSCDIDAIPEGSVVFGHQPLVRVRGSILECQLLESFLLNAINFQTLIATKAARVCQAAQDDPVLEFGLRRAQGIDGALTASRAAHIGGCAATSNALAGKLFGIPVRGTQAHSWVMSFDLEDDAFQAYAEAMPNNCVFLVDTYDSLEGVTKAIQVGTWLRQRGQEMIGVRLDSGDLVYLSIEARRLLDEAGFPDAVIVASNDLDENLIASLKEQGAKVAVWGVGTRLATAYDQPALGGVFKLSALRKPGGEWQHKIKLSEQAVKVSTPGILQVRRFRDHKGFVADMVYDELLGVGDQAVIVDPVDHTRRKRMDPQLATEDLLVPVVRGGSAVYEMPPISEIRGKCQEQLAMLHSGVKRFMNPHAYPAGLELRLYELKMKLVLDARGLHAPGEQMKPNGREATT